jgi:membrane peptidoglycan carboxypeptidase
MGNADNTPMAPGTFSSAGTGPMWKAFMLEAHQYYKLPPRQFEKPEDITIAKCAGRDEVFKAGEKPSKPGACTGPGGDPSPTPEALPDTPAPSPTSGPTVTPSPTPEASATPTPTPEGTATPTPSSATPTLIPTATLPVGGAPLQRRAP